MKKLAMAFASGALFFLATPALANESRSGFQTYAYPSYGYRYQRPYYPTIYRPYDSGAYRSSHWGYRRPVVVVRQGPPYGRAWGHRRVYPARYGYYYPRPGYYPGGGQGRSCDQPRNGWGGTYGDHDHNR